MAVAAEAMSGTHHNKPDNPDRTGHTIVCVLSVRTPSRTVSGQCPAECPAYPPCQVLRPAKAEAEARELGLITDGNVDGGAQ